MDTNNTASATGNNNLNKNKLDEVWNQVSTEKVVDFLKRTISPQTTMTELMSVLSYDKVQSIKDQLGDVVIGDVVRTQATVRAFPVPPASRPAMRAKPGKRIRSTKASIEQEQAAVLLVLQANPGINRGEIARRIRSQLGNKSLAHVSYLLRKLAEQGKVIQEGERKGAVYQAT